VIARDLIDRLAEHRTLSAASRTELEWLAAHGSIRNLNTGDALSTKGHLVEGLFIILSGRLAVFVDRADRPSKFIEWREGDVTSVLPYSRMVAPPGDVRALEPVEVFAIPASISGR
jgi:CRP-like cAMP-binding protein